MVSATRLTEDEFQLLTSKRPSLSRMTIQPERLRRNCPLDNGRLHQPSSHHSNIGTLEIFPLEIVHSVLRLLDLKSLTNLRAVSWHARATVDSLPPYMAVVSHCPDALRALLSTCMADHFTAENVFDALRSQSCCCGDFGPYLDLFTALRRCLPCVIRSPDLLSVKPSSKKLRQHLSLKTRRTLPTFLSIPGDYGESEKTCNRRVRLVRAPSNVAGELRQQDRWGQNLDRFMPMIRFPFLDQKVGKLDWGVSCQGCHLGPRDERRGYRDWNTVYTTDGYLDHFQTCQVSQIGREVVPLHTSSVAQAKFFAFFAHMRF